MAGESRLSGAGVGGSDRRSVSVRWAKGKGIHKLDRDGETPVLPIALAFSPNRPSIPRQHHRWLSPPGNHRRGS